VARRRRRASASRARVGRFTFDARAASRARSWRRTPLEYVTTTDRYIDE
jgi:hypothetical protein